VPAEAFPFSTPTGTTYDSGNYARALELALEAAGYDGLRTEQQRRRQAGAVVQLGIGLSVYVEITSGIPGPEFGAVEVRPDAKVDDVVLDKVGGRFHVTGTPAVSRSWTELAAAAGDRGGLAAEVDYVQPGPSFPFGAHVAVVEVDTDTGRVELVRMVALDDAGRILNPLLAEGQVHGGLAQGAAQALLEEMRYDDDGNPITSNLADYAFISATDLPSFETLHL